MPDSINISIDVYNHVACLIFSNNTKLCKLIVEKNRDAILSFVFDEKYKKLLTFLLDMSDPSLVVFIKEQLFQHEENNLSVSVADILPAYSL